MAGAAFKNVRLDDVKLCVVVGSCSTIDESMKISIPSCCRNNDIVHWEWVQLLVLDAPPLSGGSKGLPPKKFHPPLHPPTDWIKFSSHASGNYKLGHAPCSLSSQIRHIILVP